MVTARLPLTKSYDSKNWCFRLFDSFLIICSNTEPVPEEGWNYLLASIRDVRDKLRVLVLTDGGGPNASQRKRLSDTLAKAQTRVAVVTDNIPVRFVSSSVALFTKNIASFAKVEIVGAFAHLTLSPDEREVTRTALGEMTRNMDF